MTTFAIALKDEIRRISRKEIRARTGGTTRAVSQYRHEIAQLRKHIRELRGRLASVEAMSRRSPTTPTPQALEESDIRFSTRSVKAQRRRSGLSAKDYARLVGVSGLTIYNWETGKTRPRPEQFAALVALRGMGKREARLKLEQLGGAKAQPRKKKAKKK
jgi:DNA-binding transcriptional regulator YiaG